MAELIVALDFADKEQALALARELQGSVSWVKVGLQLFVLSGPSLLQELRQMGFKIFLDLKFMDIPNTVRGAVASACTNGVDMLTIHLLGGQEMALAALAGRESDKSNNPPLIVGVTILTSWDQESIPWPEKRPIPEIALELAKKAENWGLDGIVCSGQEAAGIKSATPILKLVTPGIRLQQGGDDQKRVISPQQAVQAGSDFIVVGRPITKAEKPVQAAQQFLQQMKV